MTQNVNLVIKLDSKMSSGILHREKYRCQSAFLTKCTRETFRFNNLLKAGIRIKMQEKNEIKQHKI